MEILWVRQDELFPEATRRVLPTEVVLDVGPGIRPQDFFEARLHLCVEPFPPYIKAQQQKSEHDPRFVYFNCTWDIAMKMLPAKSVDSVFALDVIEHFEKDAGQKFLRQAERVARNQVVIFTPLGYYPQSYDANNVRDRWGMDGGMWQAHHSGWLPQDFGMGWEFVGCESFHFEDQYGQPLEKPIGALFAFRNLATTQDSSSLMDAYLKLAAQNLPVARRIKRAILRAVSLVKYRS